MTVIARLVERCRGDGRTWLRSAAHHRDVTDPRRPRILHLAFEDHRRPNSGGGSRRTHELNSRLADQFDITVVTTRYPGALPRTEDGVRYRQVGIGGYYTSIITYHLMLPWLARRSDADLIIEDFASPVSSMAVPLWTRRPVLASVQWLFAGQTSRQYRVPFVLLEKLGLRAHTRYIAVSGSIAEELRRRRPGAQVTVVPNGLSDAELGQTFIEDRDDYIVFLGRFQWHAKGLPDLFAAYDEVAGAHTAGLVLVGDGPDRRIVDEAVDTSDHCDRIRVHGWAEGAEKRALLGRAKVLVSTSRYESFGMTVVEAMAAGTPVVGYAIPSLVELVTPDCGVLVPLGDLQALARAISELLADPARRARMGRAGMRRVQSWGWDALAERQAGVLRDAMRPDGLGCGPSAGTGPRGRGPEKSRTAVAAQ